MPTAAAAHPQPHQHMSKHKRHHRESALKKHASSAQTQPAYEAWMQGVAHRRSGELAAACECFARATELNPKDSLYWTNFGNVLLKLNRRDDALRASRTAFDLDRSNWIACHLLAQMHRDRKETQRALDTLVDLEGAVPAGKDGARHHLLIGAALVDLGRHQEAVASFLRSLTLNPQDREAHSQLGFAFAKLRLFKEAAACFRTVLLLEPTALDAALYAAHYSAWACDWKTVQDDCGLLADCMDSLQDDTVTQAISPFCLLSLLDEPQMMKFAALWDMRRFKGTAAPWPAPTQVRRAGERIRIGMVSCDFHHHATSMLIVEVLEKLDRRRFELVLYSHGPDDGSALRARVVAAADRFVDTQLITQAEQAEMIRKDQIDVLVDLKGFTMNTRITVFSERPAPVQAAWLGYPGTCGAPFIDYIIGDPRVTPLDAADDFTEHIAQMPVCYQPNDSQRVRLTQRTRAECGLPDDAFVFTSFNQSYKITEAVFSAWCRMLAQVSRGVLWLLVPDATVQAQLRQAAEQRGIDPQRLIFANFEPIDKHRLRIPLADLFIDTLPCGAHTTASDALWAGVPVLTVTGKSFAARVATSLLHAVGHEELACQSLADYEAKAVELANNPQALTRLHQELVAARDHAPLFDSTRFAQDLGDLFERMFRRWEQGLAPAALPALASVNRARAHDAQSDK